MSDIKRVTVERFDDEGNLVERIVTEYDKAETSKPYVGDTWPPYPQVYGGHIVRNPETYQSWNTPEDEVTTIKVTGAL